MNLNIDYMNVANPALIINGVALCNSLVLDFSEGEETLTDVLVTLSGEYFKDTSSALIPEIMPGERVRANELQLLPDMEKMASLTERTSSSFVVTVFTNASSPDSSSEYLRKEFEIDVMPLPKDAGGTKKITRVDIWERKLLDFSLRNSLLNLYMRQRAVQCISVDIDKVEDHLQDGDEYCILEKPDVEDLKIPDERLVPSKSLETIHDEIRDDIKKHLLHTYLTDEQTKQVLKNIYRTGKNAIEETGANPLYLAVGVLKWYESDKNETARYAPIIMLPVEMVYKKGHFYIRLRDEDSMLNVTLVEFLRQNYDIQINGLNPLPVDEHGVDVSMILTIFREALKDYKRWSVEEECILGIFSFNKFLMWNDVHSHRDELLENDIVNSLANLKLTYQPEPIVSDMREQDKEIQPQWLNLPVAADSSQMAAVYEAGKGHSFILYGPPGTGKSQTITNLIANALFQGKRVLFVAEKMAALSVVQKRLEKINLGPFCIEIHSNKVSKRHVLDQLSKALNVAHIASPEKFRDTAAQLYEKRMQLIGYIEALHNVDEKDGLSLYDCIVRYESISGDPLPGYESNDTIDKMVVEKSAADVETLLDSRLKAMAKLVGEPAQNPLVGLYVDEKTSADSASLVKDLKKSQKIIDNARKDLDRLNSARGIRKELLRSNDESLLKESGKSLADEWKTIKSKWFLPKFFAKRSFLSMMRQFNEHIGEEHVDETISNLASYQDFHNRILPIQNTARRFFGLSLELDELPSQETLDKMSEAVERWKNNTGGLRDWYHYCQYTDQLKSYGLTSVLEALEKGDITSENAKDAFFKAYYLDKARKRIQALPALRTFEGMLFDEQVEQYRKLNADFQLLSQKELYAKLAAAIPRVTDGLDKSSEIGFLYRNISNGARGISLRELLAQIPNLMPRLCPVMLMSPMSVAQFLDLNQEKFDLVIFDEASQMPTSEAIGAIARGKALVVVGDPKQMPPTSFFSASNVDEAEADIDDLESILEDCRTLQIPSLQLNWHYRSRHESLIAFSNNEYYDGNLITFPSVDDQQNRVSMVPVEGVYDRAGRRSNKAEAEKIVDEVERRLRDEELRKHSIGIVAFSVAQQNLIEDVLTEKFDSDHKLREISEEMYEPIFIKNLENVQGDERDVILFSIGYGPDKDGKVSMNFGPLNNSGGERRLNVAVSRAREEMIVFSSLKSSQIDLNRSQALGVEGLNHFLLYAEQHILTDAPNTSAAAEDSVIAEQIAEALREKGYVTAVNVGRSKFKINVAVSKKENPQTYLLGILLDGEGYRNTQMTRDREICQPSVLNGLGWDIMRVWSADWLNNPGRVLSRIVEILEKGVKATSANVKTKLKFEIEKEKEVERPTRELPYEELPMEKNVKDDIKLLVRIVEQEQPLLSSYLFRRYCAFRGMARVGDQAQKRVLSVMRGYFYYVKTGDEFLIWKDKETAQNYKNFRQDGGRGIDNIPMIEIKNAICEIIESQLSITREGLLVQAPKKMGFSRRGTKVEKVFSEAIRQLIDAKIIEERDGKMMMVG